MTTHADPTSAISVRGLVKSYGSVRALDGIDLDIGLDGKSPVAPDFGD